MTTPLVIATILGSPFGALLVWRPTRRQLAVGLLGVAFGFSWGLAWGSARTHVALYRCAPHAPCAFGVQLTSDHVLLFSSRGIEHVHCGTRDVDC